MNIVETQNDLLLLQDEMNPTDARDAALKLVDSLISYYGVMEMKVWESNHSKGVNCYKEKIQSLKSKKEEIKALTNDAIKYDHVLIDTHLSLNIQFPI